MSQKSFTSYLDKFLMYRKLVAGMLYSIDGGLMMILKSLPEAGMNRLVWISSSSGRSARVVGGYTLASLLALSLLLCREEEDLVVLGSCFSVPPGAGGL